MQVPEPPSEDEIARLKAELAAMTTRCETKSQLLREALVVPDVRWGDEVETVGGGEFEGAGGWAGEGVNVRVKGLV